MERNVFEDAVTRHQNMVYRVALHYFGAPQDADDAVQEVFLRLYTYEQPFEDPEHLRRWLLRVTVNVCKDTLKSPWRRRRVPLNTVKDQPVFDRPEEWELYQAVMAMPEKYRTVLDLFYYEELSVREIAEVLHVKQSVVTTRLHRARQKLKERLTEVMENEG